MARGRFITLEGGEGAGKSTQAARLADDLRGQGFEVVETREPGGCEGAERLRAVLLDPDGPAWDPVAEALIVSAARRDHLNAVIKPALARGAWVICDRFADSTMAYQGFGHGVDANALEVLYDMVAGPFLPDLTLILDLDPATALARARARGGANRFERLGADFHHRVNLGFLDIASRHPERCVLISGQGGADEVFDRLRAALAERMADWAAHDSASDGQAASGQAASGQAASGQGSPHGASRDH